MEIPFRYSIENHLIRDDTHRPLAAPSDWFGLPIAMSLIPGNGEVRGLSSLEPMLLVAQSGNGRRWYRSGLQTRVLSTQPATFEFYAKDFVLDYARWEGEPGQAVCVQFPEVALRELLRDDVQPLSWPILHELKDDRLVALVSELALEKASGSPNGRLYAQGLSLALVGWLRARYGVGPHLPIARGQKLSQRRAARVLEYIDAGLGDALSVAELAEVAGLSTAHFSRLFRATFEKSPHKFVLERRIRAAEKLLSSEQQTIAQVAYQLGFASQAHFTQAFRRLTGRTPGQSRRPLAR
jgi:AraC family transcriptional regulator